MARRGRKRNVEVTKVNHQPRDTTLNPQEAVRLWKAFKECVRANGGNHITSNLGSHFGRLVLLGVFNSEQYEAGLLWHEVLNDHSRIVMDGAPSKLAAKICSGEPRVKGADETPYKESDVRAAQDRYDLVLSAVTDAPRGPAAWDALVELIILDRHIDWSLQRNAGDALTRLCAVLNISRRTK
jgi:hypothetical protein